MRNVDLLVGGGRLTRRHFPTVRVNVVDVSSVVRTSVLLNRATYSIPDIAPTTRVSSAEVIVLLLAVLKVINTVTQPSEEGRKG